MFKDISIKILVSCIIICVGTYILTKSLSITAGVAILLYCIDRLLSAWVEKKERQYFHKNENNDNNDENV